MADATSVIDASALLAYLHGEAGGQRLPLLAGDDPVISAVNWSEVVQKSAEVGVATGELRIAAEDAGIEILAFSRDTAEGAAQLWSQTRSLGLSLADRACLALARELGLVALTADRRWAEVDVEGIRIELLRRQ